MAMERVTQHAADGIDRQLPAGDEIFLDHLAHFVSDADAASRALARAGFAPTPVSIQVHPDAGGGTPPTGTGNVTAMFARGYIEVLFKTADTPLGREFEAALARYRGLQLAAFAVTDAGKARRRLATSGFRVRALARMQRPVDSETGPQTAAFTIARVEPGEMAEGRIQILTHHTEHAVWQPRWLSHPNGVLGLIDVVIAVADVGEAAQRFTRFTGRAASAVAGGTMIRLDRGGVLLVTPERLQTLLPELAIPALPFVAACALKIRSAAAAQKIFADAGLGWRKFDRGLVAQFPAELGHGAWLFVEDASALPWRSIAV